MRPPKCSLYPPASRYPRKVVRSLHYDGETLTIDIQGEGFTYARIIFQAPVWFRVLDERDVCEFWNTYSEPNGWFWQVEQGGWLELESQRDCFSASAFVRDLREYFIADVQCISILAGAPPEITDLGVPPEHATKNA